MASTNTTKYSHDIMNGGTSCAYQPKTAKNRAGQSQGYVNEGASHLYEKLNASHTSLSDINKDYHELQNRMSNTKSTGTNELQPDFYDASKTQIHLERSQTATPESISAATVVTPGGRLTDIENTELPIEYVVHL
jgi:hypothetical protein